MLDLGSDRVVAVGECHTCGADVSVLVSKPDNPKAVDVRCGTCESITVLRDFEAPTEVRRDE